MWLENTIHETCIAWGFLDLLEVFFKANNLEVKCVERFDAEFGRPVTTIYYEKDSETAVAISFMAVKHLGVENMLCDYLKKCGIKLGDISYGPRNNQRDMAKLEKEWEEHRKKIGLAQ